MTESPLSAKLDWKRLHGFQQVAEDRAAIRGSQSTQIGAKVGEKLGTKIGNKVGGKIGQKLGVKLGTKTGIKA
jgi:hypothetical protein